MCDDIRATVEELQAKGVEMTREISDEGFGLLTALRLCDGSELALYEPFWITDQRQPTTENVHVAFTAPDRATVDAFHAAALEAGGTDNGPPGIREVYHPTYYGAFVLDLDGNNIEAVCHHPD